MFFTRALSILLAVCLLVTSGAALAARMDRGTGGFITICSNGQSKTVEIGYDGAPVERRHHCPDCVAIAGVLPPITRGISPDLTLSGRIHPSLPAMRHDLKRSRATARAPPVVY
ncbi:MAG: hypothetical protein ABJ327_21100 [Litoreibacter sp.]